MSGSTRTKRHQLQQLEASASDVFPLICPVEG